MKYLKILFLLFVSAVAAQAQFSFTTNNGALTVTGFSGSGAVTVPAITNGLPVIAIAGSAFYSQTTVTSVLLSSNITSVGVNAFFACSGLTNISVDPHNSVYSAVDGVLLYSNQTLAVCPPGKTGSFLIPNTVTTLADHSFYLCSKLNGVIIPDSVTNIGTYAFCYCTGLSSVTVPASVSSVGLFAFGYDAALTGIYFEGNPPPPESYVFSGAYSCIVFYLPAAAMEWGTMFDGQPTALWNPQAVDVGVRTNLFGFNIIGTSNDVVVVQGCTNLANPVWFPLQSFTLSNSTPYFSDSQWTNFSGRYYRLSSP